MVGSLLIWLLALVLIAFPVGYFAAHWDNSTFRDGAIGNWFGTVIGVLVGVPVALYLARFQQRAHERAEKVQRERDRHDRLTALKAQLYDEVVHNQGAVVQLREVLSKAPTARADVWNWARQIAESVEFAARRDFEPLVLTPVERAIDAPIALAYLNLRRLTNRVRQAAAAHDFFYGYSADEASANMQLGELRVFVNIVESNLTSAAAALKAGRGSA